MRSSQSTFSNDHSLRGKFIVEFDDEYWARMHKIMFQTILPIGAILIGVLFIREIVSYYQKNDDDWQLLLGLIIYIEFMFFFAWYTMPRRNIIKLYSNGFSTSRKFQWPMNFAKVDKFQPFSTIHELKINSNGIIQFDDHRIKSTEHSNLIILTYSDFIKRPLK